MSRPQQPPVKSGVDFEMTVTNVEPDANCGMLSIWGHLDREKLSQVHMSLNKRSSFFNSGRAMLEQNDLTVGARCCVRHPEGDGWYRGRVDEVYWGDRTRMAKVFLVDFGTHLVDVPENDLRASSAYFEPTEDQARKFIMGDIAPVHEQWSEEALEFCRRHLIRQVVYVVVLEGSIDGVPLVDVYSQGQPGVTINRIMVAKNLARATINPVVNNNESPTDHWLPFATSAERTPVSANDTVLGFPSAVVHVGFMSRVRIVHISDIKNFFVQLVEQFDSVETQLLADLARMSNYERPINITREQASPGFGCMATNEINGFMCRCIIVDILESKCRVMFVDYGNTASVPFDHLLTIPDRFRTIPAQAIKCQFVERQAMNNELDFLRAFLLENKDRIVKCNFHQILPNCTFAVSMTQESSSSGPIDLAPRISYKKLAPLDPGKYNVEVIRKDDPRLFYVTLLELSALRTALEEKLQNLQNPPILGAEHIFFGAPCLVQCLETGRWFRGEVGALVNNCERNVDYVDTGKSENFCLQQIHVISDDLVNFLAAQAIPCTLNLVDPEPSMIKKVTKEMKKLVTSKHLIAEVLPSSDCEQTVVNLFDYNVDPPYNINIMLRYMQKPQPVTVNPPPVNEQERLFITSFDSPSRFFGQMVKFNENHLTKLSSDINKRYGHLQSGEKSMWTEGGYLKPGEFCCAPYSGEYYRATIVSHKTHGRKPQVYFVDYGNTEEVDFCDVKELDSDLATECPAMGILCSIAKNYSYVMGEVVPLVKRAFLDNEMDVEITSRNDDGVYELLIINSPRNEEILTSMKAWGVDLRAEGPVMPLQHSAFASTKSACPSSNLGSCSTVSLTDTTSRAAAGKLSERVQFQAFEEFVAVSNDLSGFRSEPPPSNGSEERFFRNNDKSDDEPCYHGRSQNYFNDQNISKCGRINDSVHQSWSNRLGQSQHRSSESRDRHSERSSSALGRDLRFRNGRDGDEDRNDDNDKQQKEEIVLREPKVDVNDFNMRFVIVSCVVSPSELYCQLADLSAYLQEMNEAMQHYYNAQHPPFPPLALKVTVGLPCCTRFSLDNQWYRAIVVEEINHRTVRVRYVDFGNVEIKSKMELQSLTSEFCRVPIVAVRCSLRGVGASTNQHRSRTWSKEQNVIFETRVFEKWFAATFVAARFDHGASTYEVLLSDPSFPPLLSLNYRMIDERAAFPLDSNDKLFKSTLYDTLDQSPFAQFELQFNRAQQATVSWLVSLGLFYVQLCSSKAILHELLVICKSHSQSARPLVDFNRNAPCIAIYKDGTYESWFRAVVVEECDSNVYLFFVDYGNIECVPKKEVLSVNDEILSIPVQAFPCCFGSVEPIDRCWPMPKGENLVKYFTGGIIPCEFLGTSRGLYVVDFLVDGHPVTESLIADGVLAPSKRIITLFPVAAEIPIDSHPESFANSNVSVQSPLLEDDLKTQVELPGGLFAAVGEKVDVILSMIDSPGSFYVQRADSAELLEAFVTTLNAAYKDSTPESESSKVDLTPGSIHVALYSEDQLWYRARLLSNIDDEGQQSVVFVDYGNEETVPIENLRKIKPEFTNVPHFAANCTLNLANSGELAEFSPDFCSMFVNTLDKFVDDGGITAEFQEYQADKDIYVVKLLDKDVDLFPTVEVKSDILHDVGKFFNVVGEQNDVMVSHVNSPKDFYLQLTSDRDELATFLTEICTACDESKDFELSPSVGCLVASQQTDDGNWYRAQVLSVGEEFDDQDGGSAQILVKFIDYGNTALVPAQQIKMIPTVLRERLPYAVRCKLHGLKAGSKISSEIADSFSDAVVNATALKAEVTMTVDAKDDGITSVRLFDKDGQDIGSLFEFNAVPIGHKIEVIVTHFESPFKFFLQLVEDSSNVDNINDTLQDIFGGDDVSNDVQHEFQLGETYAVKYSTDDQWYRATVLDVTGSDGFLVRFVDFGNTEIVSPTNMRLLPAQPAHVHDPCFAFQCSLQGIEMIDEASDEKVTAKFDEVVKGAKLLAEVFEKKADGRCVVSLLNMGIDVAGSLVDSGVVKCCAVAVNPHAILSANSMDQDILHESTTTVADVESPQALELIAKEADEEISVFEADDNDEEIVAEETTGFEDIENEAAKKDTNATRGLIDDDREEESIVEKEDEFDSLSNVEVRESSSLEVAVEDVEDQPGLYTLGEVDEEHIDSECAADPEEALIKAKRIIEISDSSTVPEISQEVVSDEEDQPEIAEADISPLNFGSQGSPDDGDDEEEKEKDAKPVTTITIDSYSSYVLLKESIEEDVVTEMERLSDVAESLETVISPLEFQGVEESAPTIIISLNSSSNIDVVEVVALCSEEEVRLEGNSEEVVVTVEEPSAEMSSRVPVQEDIIEEFDSDEESAGIVDYRYNTFPLVELDSKEELGVSASHLGDEIEEGDQDDDYDKSDATAEFMMDEIVTKVEELVSSGESTDAQMLAAENAKEVSIKADACNKVIDEQDKQSNKGDQDDNGSYESSCSDLN